MPAEVKPTPVVELLGVTTQELPVRGKIFHVMFPFCGRAPAVVPNGSRVVLASARPVSKPLSITTNGTMNTVCAAVMLMTVNGGDGNGLLA